MIIIPDPEDKEEMIEVNYGKREIISRSEFEQRIKNGQLPINVDNGVYKVIKS